VIQAFVSIKLSEEASHFQFIGYLDELSSIKNLSLKTFFASKEN
jgi:hypothetical protein